MEATQDAARARSIDASRVEKKGAVKSTFNTTFAIQITLFACAIISLVLGALALSGINGLSQMGKIGGGILCGLPIAFIALTFLLEHLSKSFPQKIADKVVAKIRSYFETHGNRIANVNITLDYDGGTHTLSEMPNGETFHSVEKRILRHFKKHPIQFQRCFYSLELLDQQNQRIDACELNIRR